VTNEIVSDRDPKFTSSFWKGLFKRFGINLNLSTPYHLESNGKIEMTNRIMDHLSLKMSLFGALYGIKCNTLVSWYNPSDKVVVGPDLLKEIE
jgi:transposase InsO family protein